MNKTASKSDQDFIAMNIGLFEIYQAHAADAIPMNGRGDVLRADARRIWKALAAQSPTASVRQHATVSLQCFFENNAAACQKAFSATKNGY